MGGMVEAVAGAFGDAAEDQGIHQEITANTAIAQRGGVDAIERGNREAGLARIAGTRVAGQQRLAYTAAGVDASSGTALNVMADSKMMSNLDAATLENNALREAMGFRAKEASLGRQREAQYARSDAQFISRGANFVDSWLNFGSSMLPKGGG